MDLFSSSVSSYPPTNGDDPPALKAKGDVATITGKKAVRGSYREPEICDVVHSFEPQFKNTILVPSGRHRGMMLTCTTPSRK